jgi:hypothetical protein
MFINRHVLGYHLSTQYSGVLCPQIKAVRFHNFIKYKFIWPKIIKDVQLQQGRCANFTSCLVFYS